MVKYLMNGDTPAILFDLDDMYIQVLNNDVLPYALKDFVQTSNPANFKKSLIDIDILKDYLSSRVLNLSRENAKVILNVTSLPQSLKIDERLKIVYACKGLTMCDNFWLKDEGENCNFDDVCLRHDRLSEASYYVAILGEYMSATARELSSDISSLGMFPKYWERRSDGTYMLKTDKYSGHESVEAEVMSCQVLESVGAVALHYDKEVRDGIPFAISKCMATDKYSLASAQDVRDWCDHQGIDFLGYVKERFPERFADMCVADYVLGNPDRHYENWDFIIDNKNNNIIGLAPLYDFNQALIIDWANRGNLDELIYEPTGKLFADNIKEYATQSSLDFSEVEKHVNIPEGCKKRIETLNKIRAGDQNEDMSVTNQNAQREGFNRSRHYR
jgi:hypothetical protein